MTGIEMQWRALFLLAVAVAVAAAAAAAAAAARDALHTPSRNSLPQLNVGLPRAVKEDALNLKEKLAAAWSPAGGGQPPVAINQNPFKVEFANTKHQVEGQTEIVKATKDLIHKHCHVYSHALLDAYKSFTDDELASFFDETDATGLPRAVTKGNYAGHLIYKSVVAHSTRTCNAFIMAKDEKHASALLVPATLGLAGDVAMRRWYESIGREEASKKTQSGTVLLGYYADDETGMSNGCDTCVMHIRCNSALAMTFDF